MFLIGRFMRNLRGAIVASDAHLPLRKQPSMGRILLCDDEDTLLRSLGRILRAVGHEVVATDGPGGLARLQQERFDLVLTDIRMPGVSGFEILNNARTL